MDGITRQTVIDIARKENFKVSETRLKIDDLSQYSECFVTGTAAEVTPVSQINDYKFKVCNVITDLNNAYQNLVRKDSAA